MTNTKPQTLEIKVKLQISKPISEVFEAIVDPAQMTNYFISESTGRMEEGKELVWKFPEFDENVPVKVGKTEKDKFISYYWDAEGGDKKLLVEMKLTAKDGDKTLVTITEKEMENNEAGLKWLSGNSFGWANFLDCLKAWLEYGINLRKGSFDYMRSN